MCVIFLLLANYISIELAPFHRNSPKGAHIDQTGYPHQKARTTIIKLLSSQTDGQKRTHTHTHTHRANPAICMIAGPTQRCHRPIIRTSQLFAECVCVCGFQANQPSGFGQTRAASLRLRVQYGAVRVRPRVVLWMPATGNCVARHTDRQTHTDTHAHNSDRIAGCHSEISKFRGNGPIHGPRDAMLDGGGQRGPERNISIIESAAQLCRAVAPTAIKICPLTG